MSRLARYLRPARLLSTATAARDLRRRYSTPASGALPLQGYRVLDMTRVLAGVSLLSDLY